MEEKLFIPVILATARKGRVSENVANFVVSTIEQHKDLKTKLLDVRDYRIPSTDDSEKSKLAKKLAKTITAADGLIIVSPEYNHGYPGELKMMIDLLYTQYNRKPLGLVGVSNGPWGGVRMIEQLRLVAVDLQMIPTRNAVHFPNVSGLFDDQGNIKDHSYEKRIEQMLREMIWYAKALKPARMSIPA